MVGVVVVVGEIDEKRGTGEMVGVGGREGGVEMTVVVVVEGREYMEKASGREECLEEAREASLFLVQADTWFGVVVCMSGVGPSVHLQVRFVGVCSMVFSYKR